VAKRQPALGSSWRPVDLVPLLKGRRTERPPRLVRRADGLHLLYRSKLHFVYGEPESGKGWFALHASAERLREGERVVYIDFEDDEREAVTRLLALGVPKKVIATQFAYVRPDEPLTEEAWRELDVALDPSPALVVLDGVTEALANEGVKLEDNTEVARWITRLPRRLARAGAAVIVIDHVVKDREARGRYAIGAQHKLAGADVSFRVEGRETFGRGKSGSVRVLVTKDRPGYLRACGMRTSPGVDWIADMCVSSSSDDSVAIELAPPRRRDGDFLPTRQMEDASRLIEETPGIGAKALRVVPGDNTALPLALTELEKDKYIEIRKEGSKHAHYSVKPYREGEEA